jgi:hypothetical protein
VSAYHEVTYAYNLPTLPSGWHWKVWEDVVDGHPKVFIRLSDQLGHCAGLATIDVEFYGKGSAVLERASRLAEALT